MRDLEQDILTHDDVPTADAAPKQRTRSTAPGLATGTAFLGRDDDVAALVDLLQRRRLVTVTGVAGVGKSRLVTETLPTLTERLGLDHAVVELAHVEPRGVTSAIAAALGIGPAAEDAGEATLEYLSVTPMLLVLDPCEHVLAHCHGSSGVPSTAAPVCVCWRPVVDGSGCTRSRSLPSDRCARPRPTPPRLRRG
jgi:hypothetical protein